MEHQKLYDEICTVLTWYENPEDYPFEEEAFNRHIANELYNVLVRVQREMFNH